MNKLILLFVFLPFLSFAQFDDPNLDPLYSADGFTKKIKAKAFTFQSMGIEEPTDEINLQLDFIRYCNYKHYKQRQTAYVLWGLGTAIGVAPLFIPDDNFSTIDKQLQFTKATGIASAALNLIAIVVFIDSDKWLKYSSVKPASNGLGVTITF